MLSRRVHGQPEESEEDNVAVAVAVSVYGSNNRGSSFTMEDAQLVTRRDRGLHAVWARTEEPFTSEALNSVCVTCGQQVDEPLAALCDNYHRRVHSLVSCERACRWLNTFCVFSVISQTQMLICTEQKVAGMG